ncbi:MAG: hypothetical protein RL141_720 [Candidatus Parcubacteria bacterium]|jgi:tetratricopeptide (TPR) repeat protein
MSSLLFWALIVIAAGTVGVMGVVLWRHWKEIRLLDPATIKAEQERQVRERIVRQRFDRRLRHLLAPVNRFGRLAGSRMVQAYQSWEQRLSHTAGAMHRDGGIDPFIPGPLRDLLDEASAHLKKRAWAPAERLYLEVLKQDSRQLQAYRGLGELYMAQGMFAQAKETLLFLEQIQGCDDACYANLAAIAEAEKNMGEAEAMRKRAVDVAPQQALRHAELAAFYLAHGSPEYAWASAVRATDLEPGNPRSLELSIEAAILIRDREEAERRYEQLRPLVRDRQALQSLREKIDNMPL